MVGEGDKEEKFKFGRKQWKRRRRGEKQSYSESLIFMGQRDKEEKWRMLEDERVGILFSHDDREICI